MHYSIYQTEGLFSIISCEAATLAMSIPILYIVAGCVYIAALSLSRVQIQKSKYELVDCYFNESKV